MCSPATEAIQRLMYTYAECVDLARFEELGQLFEHGTMRSDKGDQVMSGDTVRDFYYATNRIHPNGTLCTRHLATNVIIDVDEDADRATARSYFVVFQATDLLPLQPIVAGRYHDVFERVDGTWRFADRMVLVDQIGNMAEHLTIDMRTERVDIEGSIAQAQTSGRP